MYNSFVRDTFGRKQVCNVRYSDVKEFYYGILERKQMKATTMDIYAEATEAKKCEVMASLEGKIIVWCWE